MMCVHFHRIDVSHHNDDDDNDDDSDSIISFAPSPTRKIATVSRH